MMTISLHCRDAIPSIPVIHSVTIANSPTRNHEDNIITINTGINGTEQYNMRVITISMMKGGVGKTTITREIAAYLAMRGRRVLLIPCDFQGCLSDDVGAKSSSATLLDILKQPDLDTWVKAVAETSVVIDGEGLIEIVPHGEDMIEIEPYLESVLNDGGDPWRILGRALGEIADMYDDVLLDTSPNNGRLTDIALTAASQVYATGDDPSGIIYVVEPGQKYNADIARTNDQRRTLALGDIVVDALGIVINRYYRKRSKTLERNYQEISARPDVLGVIPDRVAAMSQARDDTFIPAVLAEPDSKITDGIKQVVVKVTPTLQKK